MATENDKTSSLAEQKREQLRHLLLQKIKQPEKLAASCAQRRLWLVNQLEQPNASYNIPCHITLRGSLDISLLEKSINQLIARHSILRTAFSNNDGEPLQNIFSELKLTLPFDDLTDGEKTDRQKKIANIIRQESATIFDLRSDPLIRVRLIQSYQANETENGKDEYILIIILHHIISDGWSMGVLANDLFAIYDSLKNNNKAPGPLTLQYSDYTRRQSQWLNSDNHQQQLAYWKQHLQDLALLELPTDFSRPRVKGFNGANVLTRIDAPLVKKLKALSDQQSVTLNMLLSTVFSLLLHRYTGQNDIVFGSPVANRNQTDIENLIGFFVNMLVVRNQLDPAVSFTRFLQQSRDNLFSAYSNQDIPFEHLVDELQPERDRSRNPIFQVVFAMQNETMPAIELDGLSVGRPVIPGYDVSEYGVKANVTRFDLELHCWDTEDDVRCSWIYDTALFTQSTIERMSRHFAQLLETIVAQPDSTISSLSILNRQEHQALIHQFAETQSDYPSNTTVNRLFEQQVEITPDAPALVFENQRLSYAELNQRANQLAHYLLARGVKPEVMVGLSVERSLDMVIALLGILKAGGAYVPLDPEYPASRIAFMLEDTAAPVVITQSSLKNHLPAFNGETICLDQDWPEIARQAKTNPDSQLTANSLMYVIYTSGSTGLPKGVCVEHRSAIRLVKNTNYINIKADDVFLQFAPVAFDASTLELWGCLLNGAKLVVYPPQKTSLEQLGQIIEENAVTTLWLTSALFSQMVELHLSALKGVSTLLAGGEALSVPHVKKYLAFLDKNVAAEHQLINGYGPTENTTFTCCHVMYKPSDVSHTVAIGKPISNTSVYILDKQMNPVPEGVAGELFIGGDGLARGYLNRDDLTGEKFITHNLFDNQPVRLYRTGDLVCFRQGIIEFIRRVDHQVKVRGYRIELGEVESVLKSLAYVTDAVASVHNIVSGDEDSQNKQLIAYVVFSDRSKTTEDIKHDLREQLPAYMIPGIIMSLEKIPVTANGKVDRRVLPVPVGDRSGLGTEYIAPRNEIEEQLAQIWTEVLKLERVGVFDDFFDLGGHSLMATRVISRIREHMAVDIPLSEIFGYPSVAELAPVVGALLDESDGAEVNAIVAVAHEGDLALSFAQERLWFLDQLEPDNPFYNIPLVISLQGKLSESSLLNSLKAIVSRHDALRTHFVTRHGQPVQVVDENSCFEVQQEDISDMPTEARDTELKVRVREESLKPFDLEKDHLIRARLIRLCEDEHVLLFTMHHIISDGWSLGVLYSELTIFYAAFSSGQQPELRTLPVQYADFAAWQRDWLSGDVLASQLTYWRQQLADLPTLALPLDRPRPAVQSFNGAMIQHDLSNKLSQQLDSFSQHEGVSLFMTLLAAFSVLLNRYSGQQDIVVGSPIANRTRTELEGLIGFFVNSLVMRTDVSGNPSFSELVQRVNQTALGAFDHQDLPFEKLVDEIQPERDLSQNPLFQVMFALQNAPMEPLALKGLMLQAISLEIQTTRFDLEVHILERTDFLSISLIYNTDLFDKATINRMFSHYQQLMQGMMSTPGARIADIPMLQDQEYQQIVNQWNSTTTNYPYDKTVHELFEKQVSANPDVCAVEYEGNILSYAQLNERANQLAHYLQAREVGPDVLVGLCVGRSLEMVVALLGIMKAGGAYLPLDPDYPHSRLSFMLEDARIKTILTTSAQRSRLPPFSGDMICLDTDWPTIAEENTDNPVSAAKPNNLVYVIYTSGSTGRPKGTLIEHQSVVRLVKETNYVELGAQEVFLQFAPISFDASTFELWGCLLNGAKLVVFPAGRTNLEELAQVIQEKGVTTLWLTSALFSQMVDYHLDSLSGVQQLLAGGEALSLPHVKKMLAQLGERRLINGYGPTENTTFTCCHVMTGTSSLQQSVPIGRPISNTTVYILDTRMKPVPVGVPGELYIGGDGLARGYLNQAQMTSEKFVPNPFSKEPAARLYATGDQVRYQIDGTIEFIGRIDHQVKVRGYRIELGEIESALVAHTAVHDAVVIVREDEPGDKRLVAYTVPTTAWVEQISGAQSGEHVEQWQALYEETYGSIDASLDLTSNFTGWNSSYTGEPIPLEEMTEWLEATVARIAAFKPVRVLEIGCGTGLLLYRLAPACERYVGTDFSAIAQQQVRGVVSARDTYQHVELWQRMADDFSDIEAGDFDTIIINSVVQYLPSMDYLASVIEGAVQAICDGGRIIIGDIRSLPLLKAYHTSIQLYLSPDDASSGELMRNIQQHVEEENELVIEPAFFHALKQRIPRISHVEVLLKHGNFHNELSGYRYDVILHVEAPAEPLGDKGQWLEWGALRLSEAQLRDRLNETDQVWLGINAIPNARIASDVAVLDQLEGDGSSLSVGELKRSVKSAMQQPVEPGVLWHLAEKTGYQLELSYTGAGTDGRMDALFRRRGREQCAGYVFWSQQQDVPARSWSAYGSNPLKGKLGNELIPLLRQDIQKYLPEYMVPSVYVILDELPLNPNSKVDRKALPVPGDVRASLGTEYTAPRTELEQQLAQIWAEVLKLELVGIHDNFFDLGGHSLMATQVVHRVCERMNVELPLSEMFGYPTVAELAQKLEMIHWTNQARNESDFDGREVFKI